MDLVMVWHWWPSNSFWQVPKKHIYDSSPQAEHSCHQIQWWNIIPTLFMSCIHSNNTFIDPSWHGINHHLFPFDESHDKMELWFVSPNHKSMPSNQRKGYNPHFLHFLCLLQRLIHGPHQGMTMTAIHFLLISVQTKWNNVCLFKTHIHPSNLIIRYCFHFCIPWPKCCGTDCCPWTGPKCNGSIISLTKSYIHSAKPNSGMSFPFFSSPGSTPMTLLGTQSLQGLDYFPLPSNKCHRTENNLTVPLIVPLMHPCHYLNFTKALSTYILTTSPAEVFLWILFCTLTYISFYSQLFFV